MALWFRLKANHMNLGLMEIRRVTNPNKSRTPDVEVNVYEVYIDDKLIGEVDHRYGDGPWALVQKATTLATYHPSGEYGRRLEGGHFGMRIEEE